VSEGRRIAAVDLPPGFVVSLGVQAACANLRPTLHLRLITPGGPSWILMLNRCVGDDGAMLPLRDRWSAITHLVDSVFRLLESQYAVSQRGGTPLVAVC